MAQSAVQKVNAMMHATSDKIDAAEKITDITARTDSLVSLREETDAAFGKTMRNQVLKMVGAAALVGLGAFALYTGLFLAFSVWATLAGTTGYTLPVAALGLAGMVGGGTGLTVSAMVYKSAKNTWKSMTNMIDGKIQGLIKTHPEETQKASKLADYLKLTSRFNPAASADSAPSAPAPGAAPAAPTLKA
jgi:hypothetical protein